MVELDCAVVGAGPGGLTAAIYLARYLRDVLVLDDRRSRALWIPRSHNCPGYPEGIPGPDLLDRLRRQAERYGVSFRQERVESLQRSDDGSYILTCGSETIHAQCVLLATGAEDVQAPIPDLDGAIRRGVVRHCPTCDAYEVRDRAIAILGAGDCRLQEATLLRSYTSDLTVLSLRRPLEMSEEERSELLSTGVALSHEQKRDQHDGDVADRIDQHLGRAEQQRVMAQRLQHEPDLRVVTISADSAGPRPARRGAP